MVENIFTSIRHISLPGLFSYDVYKTKVGGREKQHYHTYIEIVHVIKGNSKTHKQGRWYFYRSGKIHEFVNDSKDEMIIAVTSIPSESEKNTVYVD